MGILFYLALKACKELYLTPIRAYEASFKKKMNLSTQTCSQFLCVTIQDFLIIVLIELPTLIVTVIALTLSK